ncbi:transmembrane glucosamine N-acetyltransferase NagX [Pseudoalteromonas fenneropenaei]|uniref:Transmembrane glucosamine N-acetyltransferase NagX n=1 Tax=Pseudoalteromonas fenneropenaei TaxID=1737459 RepID=A0ABV7CQ43_9GAMM
MTTKEKKRLASLDALRGFDMIWILGGQSIFAALLVLTGWQGWQTFAAHTEHSLWHGFTFYDLIFPLFIFLSGVAMGLAPKRINHLPSTERIIYYRKALKRFALLCLLGILYNHGWGTGIPADLSEVRYASVLGRIAFAWLLCVLLVWHLSLRQVAFAGVGILLAYWLLLCFIPVPGGSAGDLSQGGAGSWNAWVDSVFLPGISYQNRAVDPEGILSSFPAVVNAIAGVFAGRLISKSSDIGEWKVAGQLFAAGLMSLALGWSWDLQFPVNKELWTSSFVLVTVGWSAMLLAVFFVLVDILPGQRLAYPFVIIGANSIIIYLASSVVNWEFIRNSLFGGLIAALPNEWQPLFAVLGLLLVQLLVLHWLYKRKLFISV